MKVVSGLLSTHPRFGENSRHWGEWETWRYAPSGVQGYLGASPPEAGRLALHT